MLQLLSFFLIGFFFALFLVRIAVRHYLLVRIMDKKHEYAKSLLSLPYEDLERHRMYGFILGLAWVEEQFTRKK